MSTEKLTIEMISDVSDDIIAGLSAL